MLVDERSFTEVVVEMYMQNREGDGRYPNKWSNDSYAGGGRGITGQ
jgi:hypothetical protein